MKRKSVSVNAILNVVKQVCAIIFPLITFPYVSRVLQAENYGKVNFSNSVISYFVLIAALGISPYAIREGARIRRDKKKFQTFSEQIFTINVISTAFSYVLLLLFCICWSKLHAYWNLLIVQSLSIVLATIGADWVNSIYEDYLYITIRYIVVHCISIALMFIFVKKPEDYVIYAAISVFASAGANVSNIFHIRKYTHLKFTRHPEFKRHFKPLMMLFCNSLSVQIYVNSDVTMLGIFKDDAAVGIYSAAVKIYSIIKQLLNAVITVTIPRISALLGENKTNEYNKLLDKTFHSVLTLTLPAITGIFMLSYEIIYIIGGEQYAEGYWALRILSIALACAVFANFYNNSILIPNKKEKHFLIATLTAAFINVGFNLFLIPVYGYIGAALTTVLAELAVLIFGIHYSKGLYSFKTNKRDILTCVLGCLCIAATCTLLQFMVENIYYRALLSICISIIVYIIVLCLFRNRLAVTIEQFIIRKIDNR